MFDKCFYTDLRKVDELATVREMCFNMSFISALQMKF